MKIWYLTLAAALLGLGAARGSVITLTASANDLYDTGWTNTGLGSSFITNNNFADGHYLLEAITPGPNPPGVTSFPATTYSIPNSTITTAGWVQGNSPSGSINGSGQTVGADWVTFSSTTASQSNTPNVFDYRLNITNLVAGATITITGNFGGDDSLTIYADGNATQLFSNPNWGTSAAGTLTFTATGSDYLDFLVNNSNNSGGYTGLFVNDLAGTMTVVPEPREWALIVMLGAVGLMIFRRVRHARAA